MCIYLEGAFCVIKVSGVSYIHGVYVLALYICKFAQINQPRNLYGERVFQFRLYNTGTKALGLSINGIGSIFKS